MRRLVRAGAVLLALAPLAAMIAGCGAEKKVAVHVNKELITEEEFLRRVQNVTAAELAESANRGGATRAGEFVLRQMIHEKLLLQAAAEKKAAPTDAQVNSYLAFAKRFPNLAGPIATDPNLTDDDRRRIIRATLAYRLMAKAPLNLTEADLKKVYDREKAALKVPEQYHLRVVTVSSQEKANQALAALKKNVSFEAVASSMSDNPQARAKQGDIGNVPANALPPDILNAVKDLPKGQYTPKPIAMPAPAGSGGAAQRAWILVQVVEKIPGVEPTIEDVRPYLEMAAMAEKDATWQQRVAETLRQNIDKADIQVSMEAYKDLPKKVKEEAARSGAAPKGPQPPGPAPGPAPAPPAG